jgi:hypothetical protein
MAHPLPAFSKQKIYKCFQCAWRQRRTWGKSLDRWRSAPMLHLKAPHPQTLVGIVGVGILTYYVYKKLLSEPDQPAKPADKTKTNTDADKKKMGCLESKPEEEGAPQVILPPSLHLPLCLSVSLSLYLPPSLSLYMPFSFGNSIILRGQKSRVSSPTVD